MVPTQTQAQAQALTPSRKDTAVLAMALEPPGLDPTAGAASAIAEVVLYNIFETLTKIQSDGSTQPLLADSWTSSADLKTWTFKLKTGVKFHNDQPFNAAAVKFSFERAAEKISTNKDRATFANIESSTTPDAAITLQRWESWRGAADVKLKRVTLRFISDPAAQVAALLAGDVDAFPRVSAARSLKQFQGNQKFQVLVGASRAKTIVAMNRQRKPLHDVRVRRAIAIAIAITIDRQAVIEGSADGFGVAIGSCYVPGTPGFVDTTAVNPYDPAQARALLQQAGVAVPLLLTMKLPPVPCARQGGEVVAAMLAKVGITVKMENIEWAQWRSGVYGGKAYDLTVISHVEPLDFGNFARPNDYWGYESAEFNALWARIQATPKQDERNALMADAQRLVARDVVSVYLYQPTWITVANARLKGLWKDMPLLVNDLSAMAWQ